MDEDYFRLMLSSAKRHDVEDSGLNLDAPSVVKVRRMKKSRSRTGRSEINSVYRKSNAISKGRKRKAKLQSSISKSTVTTKDTGFISREEVKKRRRKGKKSNSRTISTYSFYNYIVVLYVIKLITVVYRYFLRRL